MARTCIRRARTRCACSTSGERTGCSSPARPRSPTRCSTSVFNAMLPDIVQIGGVWTPPEFRGRGYARAVVAGSLLAARKQGVARAVLFADPANERARRAYQFLGFRIVGDYGLVLLALHHG